MRSVLAASLAFASIVACSSNPPPAPSSAPVASSAPAAPAPAIARGDFAAKLAKTVCEASKPCCIGGTSYDEDVCSRQFLEKLGWKERLEKTKSYESKHAAKCIEEARGVASQCKGARDDILRQPSCAALLFGTKKTGERCEENEDCAPLAKGHPFCWTGANADEPGRCAASLPAEKGASCFTPLGKYDKSLLLFSECNDDPNLVCDKATNKCGPRQKAGGACEQGYECDDASSCIAGKCKSLLGTECSASRDCSPKQACVKGKCAVGKKLGEKCAEFAECAEGMCGGTGSCMAWAGAFLCKAPGK